MSLRIAAVAVTTCLAASPLPAAAQMAAAHASHAAEASKPGHRTTQPLAGEPRLGGLSFVDADGRTRTLAEAVTSDQPVLLNFIFTTCTTICPVMSAGFSDVRARLAARGQGVRLVSVSIDPEFDTPAKLKAYAAKIGAGPEWVFLTGSAETVEAAERAFGAWRGSKEGHIAATFIRRGPSARWERLDGLVGGAELMRAIIADSPAGQH